jgi:hypothetical protein
MLTAAIEEAVNLRRQLAAARSPEVVLECCPP